MANDLFFIPILSRALSEADPQRGLSEAFVQIQQLKDQLGYEQGYAQFKAWVEMVAQAAELSQEDWMALIMPAGVGVRLLRGEVIVGQGSLSLTEGRAAFDRIFPGHYHLEIETGQLLWEAELREEDLMWTKAFPDQELALAATTEEVHAEPTRSFSLLDGEIILNVYPGIESGRVKISWYRYRSKSDGNRSS